LAGLFILRVTGRYEIKLNKLKKVVRNLKDKTCKEISLYNHNVSPLQWLIKISEQ